MKEHPYLLWLARETQSCWWHDSADPDELRQAMANGAVGLTSNPFLIQETLIRRPDAWRGEIAACPPECAGDLRAEKLLSLTVKALASQLKPVYDATGGRQGFACAQVNPARQGDAEQMLSQARRYAQIAPNVSIKLPATAAGLAAMEECVAEGMCTTITASFTVPQALAIGARYARGREKAVQRGVTARHCFAVLMIGRLDDYLRDVAHDLRAAATEEDIRLAGIAVAKRAYALYGQRGYLPTIMPAGLRGAYHVTELAGAKMVFSLAPKIQEMLRNVPAPYEERIDRSVDSAAIARLMELREFRRAYEPDGMAEDEFLAYGATQRTLSQFVEAGWARIALIGG